MQSNDHPVFSEDLPEWVPEDVLHYLIHTGAGVSIREIARASQHHASTISRRIRRIEQQRDDPLIDAALRRMEAQLQPSAPENRLQMKRELSIMTDGSKRAVGGTKTLSNEMTRVLRRLCETGAVLAIAADMDVAVVVREGPDGSTARTAVVAQEVAQAMAVQGLIETGSTGRILRYKITSAGKCAVKGQLEARNEHPRRMHMAESAAEFEGGYQDESETGGVRRQRYTFSESPLTVLSRRRDREGQPFLSEDLVRCGERLREDFELAQLDQRTVRNWDVWMRESEQPISGGSSGYGPDAAKDRVFGALQDLGPGLGDVALQCCCFLEGLESTEKRMGWSARSGKIVLRIALQRLKQYYETNLTADAHMIG